MNETLDAVIDRSSASADALLDRARTRIEHTEGAYSGAVTPTEAWQLAEREKAKLIDVRTAAEVRYVGRVPGSLHVEWHGTDREQVQRFVRDLALAASPAENVLLICRSGVRSHHAARAAHAVGYGSVFNVLEGFEGQRNHAQQRGFVDGWRSHGLPWIQD